MTTSTCTWPDCSKRVRHEGMCRAHHRRRWNAVVGIALLEGPVGLSRHLVTDAEAAAFDRTGQLPASRNYQPTAETTRMRCAACGGPLVMCNGDWTPGAPATIDDHTPWGIGVCRTCSFSDRPSADTREIA